MRPDVVDPVVALGVTVEHVSSGWVVVISQNGEHGSTDGLPEK